MDVERLDAAVRDAFGTAASARASDGGRALEALEALKRESGCWKLCLEAYGSARASAETKFWCLQTLTETLRNAEATTRLSEGDAEALRRSVGTHVSDAATVSDGDGGSAAPVFVKNKLAQVCAHAVALEYPTRWPMFFGDLSNLLTRGESGVDMFTRVLEAIDEEVVATVEAGRGNRDDVARSMRIKDAMRADGSLQLIFGAWRDCLEHFKSHNPRLAARVWTVARRYVDWVDINIVASAEYLKCVRECLALNEPNADEGLRSAATAYMHAVVTKGMDIEAKVRLIASTNVLEICSSLLTICISRPDDFDEEFVTQVTTLAVSVGLELLNANKVENITTLGAESSSQVSALLHQVTPMILSAINFRHERAVLTALPFLTAYIGYIKSQPALMNTEQPALTAACQAVVARGTFPTEHIEDLDWNDGTNALTQEFEEDVFNLRAELNVQFRNIARLAPHIAREVVRQILTNTLVGGAGKECCWQNIEVAVSALYTLGEGADDAAVKPMSNAEKSKATNGSGDVTDTPLGAMAVTLIKGWGASVGHAAYHRLVAPIFMEVCVRYHAVLERDDEAMIAALSAFLDERGIAHADPMVRSRACYLLSRLIRPLRTKLSDKVEHIMVVLPKHLKEVARTLPEPETMKASAHAASAAGVQSKAMAETGNDDSLYLFEAVGTLLGCDDVDEEEQYKYLSQIAMSLCEQMDEAVRGQASADDQTCMHLATRTIVAFGNISKGFSQRTCLTLRPRTGAVFQSCLEMSIRCLDRWPRDASVRNRTTGFLHRMIDLIRENVTPYLATTVDKLRRDADMIELKDTLALFNQLASTYKATLAPFVVEVLPGLSAQVFAALANAFSQASAQSASGDIAKNTEMMREADELERMWLLTTTALGLNELIAPTFTGHAHLETTTQLREQMFSHLVRAASSHGVVSARKVALQALRRFIEEWVPPAETTSEAVAGFTKFVVERVCPECCLIPPARGDLDLSDAVSVSALNESFAILSIVAERRSSELSRVLETTFDAVVFPATDRDTKSAIKTEYANVFTAAINNNHQVTRSSKTARVLLDAVLREASSPANVAARAARADAARAFLPIPAKRA